MQDNNSVVFLSDLNSLKDDIYGSSEVDGNSTVDNITKGHLLLLSGIGCGEYSQEFWSNAVMNDIFSDSEEIGVEGLAPWVAADAVGGVVGVYGNILTDVATGSNSSWSTYAISFLWSAASSSLGGFSIF